MVTSSLIPSEVKLIDKQTATKRLLRGVSWLSATVIVAGVATALYIKINDPMTPALRMENALNADTAELPGVIASPNMKLQTRLTPQMQAQIPGLELTLSQLNSTTNPAAHAVFGSDTLLLETKAFNALKNTPQIHASMERANHKAGKALFYVSIAAAVGVLSEISHLIVGVVAGKAKRKKVHQLPLPKGMISPDRSDALLL